MSSAEPCVPQGDELWVDTETNLVMELTTQDLKAFDKTQRVRKHQKRIMIKNSNNIHMDLLQIY